MLNNQPLAKTRRAQKDATRARLLEAAVETLIDCGVARTTTLEVQKRAGVSRGALLHHFPLHSDLLSATVEELVRRNEASVWREAERIESGDPIARGVRALVAAYREPSFMAELELWVVARVDEQLRCALRSVERNALKENERVLRTLFAPVCEASGYPLFAALTVQFVRGLMLNNVLRDDQSKQDALVEGWITTSRHLLSSSPQSEPLA